MLARGGDSDGPDCIAASCVCSAGCALAFDCPRSMLSIRSSLAAASSCAILILFGTKVSTNKPRHVSTFTADGMQARASSGGSRADGGLHACYRSTRCNPSCVRNLRLVHICVLYLLCIIAVLVCDFFKLRVDGPHELSSLALHTRTYTHSHQRQSRDGANTASAGQGALSINPQKPLYSSAHVEGHGHQPCEAARQYLCNDIVPVEAGGA